MRNAVILYHGPLGLILVMAFGLLAPLGLLWWILGPSRLRRPKSLRRIPGRPYRFRDDHNGPLP
jgi:hypothetical protein